MIPQVLACHGTPLPIPSFRSKGPRQSCPSLPKPRRRQHSHLATKSKRSIATTPMLLQDKSRDRHVLRHLKQKSRPAHLPQSPSMKLRYHEVKLIHGVLTMYLQNPLWAVFQMPMKILKSRLLFYHSRTPKLQRRSPRHQQILAPLFEYRRSPRKHQDPHRVLPPSLSIHQFPVP